MDGSLGIEHLAMSNAKEILKLKLRLVQPNFQLPGLTRRVIRGNSESGWGFVTERHGIVTSGLDEGIGEGTGEFRVSSF